LCARSVRTRWLPPSKYATKEVRDIIAHLQFSSNPALYANGTSFNITAGERWLFDLPISPYYNTIQVFGTLVFSDALVRYLVLNPGCSHFKHVQLNAQNIYVQSTGQFLIGSCDCPYQHKAIIELQAVADKTYNPFSTGCKTVCALFDPLFDLFSFPPSYVIAISRC
jgi:hypothetical protein